MELRNLLNLNRGCMVSIVGAAGKSTLMYTLAGELKRDNKILVTTTTKIYLPEKEQYDFIEIGANNFIKLKHRDCKGIYVYGSSVNKDNKLVGVIPDELEGQLDYFDYILVEADGSKRKPIKGWNATEPVVCKDTTKTIGVLSIESIGKKINEDNVHRVEEFINITNSIENAIITEENIVSLVFNRSGLFKNSVGEKILFINKIETQEQKYIAQKLLHSIRSREKNNFSIDKIIIGSLKNKNYELV